MLPVEPRLKPLCATFIHVLDSNEGKDVGKDRKLLRCHSFSGYVPYHLEQEDGDIADTIPSNCSNGSSAATPDTTDIGDEGYDSAAQAWPDTDDEWEGPESGQTTMEANGVQVTVVAPAYYVAQGEELVLEPCQEAVAAPAWTWDLPEDKVIHGVCRAVAEAAAAAPTGRRSCFDFNGEPPDIHDYIWQLYRTCCCDTTTFVWAFAYLCRISETNRGKVEVNTQTIHRLLLAAVTTAAKQQQLYMYDNTFYAHAAGVSVPDLNKLEARFLELLNWNLDVCPKTFKRIFRLLCKAAA